MKCGYTYFGEVVHNFIVVIVDYECDPRALGAQQVAYGKWVLMLDRNCIDCKVPGCGENAIGVIVGCHSTIPKKPSHDRAKIKFLYEIFHSSGLNRSKTTHDGKFSGCSYGQSHMASGSMAQVSLSSDYHYFDESKMQVSLLNFSYPIVNDLANQAMNVRDNSGKIKMGVIKKAVWKISGEQTESKQIVPHIIFTAP